MLIERSDCTTISSTPSYYIGEYKPSDNPLFSYIRKNTMVCHFNSLKAVWSAISSLGWKPQKSASSDQRDRSDFHTFDSLQEALDTYTNKPQTIREFSEETIALTSEENIGKDVNFDVTGDFIDIGRFMEGVPECFGVSYNGNPSSIRVNLLINAVAVSHVTSEALAHRQKRILRLVDWLEHQGIRCRINAYESTSIAHIEIMLKDFHEPLDINDVAIVNHGDFLRRVVFLIDEQSQTWEYGYGNSRYFTQAMEKNYKAPEGDGITIFIGDQQTSDLEKIDHQFNLLRDKLTSVITEPHKNDLSLVYSVQL